MLLYSKQCHILISNDFNINSSSYGSSYKINPNVKVDLEIYYQSSCNAITDLLATFVTRIDIN